LFEADRIYIGDPVYRRLVWSSKNVRYP